MKIAKGSATVATETQSGAQTGSSEQVDTGIEVNPEEPQCEIEFGAGFTKPTEPYGNVKVFVSLKLTGDLDERDELYDFAEGWVGEKLGANMAALNEQYPSS